MKKYKFYYYTGNEIKTIIIKGDYTEAREIARSFALKNDFVLYKHFELIN